MAFILHFYLHMRNNSHIFAIEKYNHKKHFVDHKNNIR